MGYREDSGVDLIKKSPAGRAGGARMKPVRSAISDYWRTWMFFSSQIFFSSSGHTVTLTSPR